MVQNSFQLEKQKNYTLKIRQIVKDLPPFCASYFRAMENTTSILTRYGYAIDLRSFFQFLTGPAGPFPDRSVSSLTISDLNSLRAVNIEEFIEEMSLYVRDEREITNQERAKARKLATLRSFFKY